MIGRLLSTVFAGVLVAGLVHVIAVLTLPGAAPRNAVVLLAEAARSVPPGAMVPIAADGSVIPDLDPLFVHAACVIDASAGPVELAGDMPDGFWTAAVLSESQGIVASLQRAAGDDTGIDLYVGSPDDVEQTRLGRAGAGAGLTTSYASVGAEPAAILVRAFVPPTGDRAAVAARLQALRCVPAPKTGS